jgi:hypothetical protein
VPVVGSIKFPGKFSAAQVTPPSEVARALASITVEPLDVFRLVYATTILSGFNGSTATQGALSSLLLAGGEDVIAVGMFGNIGIGFVAIN